MKGEIYRRGVLATRVFVVLMLMGFLPKLMADTGGGKSSGSATTSKQHVAEVYGKAPLAFEANKGQTSDQVEFLSRGPGYALFLTRHAEAVLRLDAASTYAQSIFRMKLVNAEATPQAEGLEELPGKANYFIGNDPKKWRRNVPMFSRVQYRSVYPGVDLVYYGNQTQLENDFIVAPGADPRSITLSFDGAKKLSLDSQGNLVLAAKTGEVRLEKPRIYQEVDGARREIPGDYVLKNAHEAGFQVTAYDASKSLVIDPVLSYSTYLGGSGGYGGGDSSAGIVVDSGGNAYIIGTTGSTDFPTTPGAFQTTGPPACPSSLGCSSSDVFVTKLNPQGSALVYSSFLGGTGLDYGSGIAVDSSGNAYLTGTTCSSDFPTTAGAFQTVFRGNVVRGVANAFVAKVDPTGSSLVYSTYLGGSDGAPSNVGGTCYHGDQGTSIAVDPNGDAYVSGGTPSSDFPTTPGSFQPSYHSTYQGSNAFITKLNPTGTALLYSTYLGGSNYDAGYGIAVDQGGHAYATGRASSTDFPTTPGAFQIVSPTKISTFGTPAGISAFVAEMNADGTALVYSTYLGGNGQDIAIGIAVDSVGSAYITGSTNSIDFPTTLGAFQFLAPVKSGPFELNSFMSKLNDTGSRLVYSTYLGGSSNDEASSIAVDSAGDAFLTGYTTSIDFPITANAIQPLPADGGNGDAFVLALNPQGATLVYSSYLGGSGGGTGGRGIALDSSFNAYVVGGTASTNFPTTPGAFQSTAPPKSLSFEQAAFVTKISGIL